MHVKTNLTRIDLLRAYVSIQFGIKFYLWSFTIFFAYLFYYFNFSIPAGTNVRIFVVIILAIYLTALSFIVGIIYSIIFIICTATEKSGVLGEHDFYVSAEGLKENTKANQTLIKWHGIKSVKKTKNYIFIQINYLAYHIIPRRSFDDQDSYDKFWNEILTYHTAAKKNPPD